MCRGWAGQGDFLCTIQTSNLGKQLVGLLSRIAIITVYLSNNGIRFTKGVLSFSFVFFAFVAILKKIRYILAFQPWLKLCQNVANFLQNLKEIN